MKEHRRPLDHSLGFHSCPTQTSFKSLLPRSKNIAMQCRILESDNLWTLTSGVKGGEAEFLVSCNQFGGNRRPLNLKPQCEVALTNKGQLCLLYFLLYINLESQLVNKKKVLGSMCFCTYYILGYSSGRTILLLFNFIAKIIHLTNFFWASF